MTAKEPNDEEARPDGGTGHKRASAAALIDAFARQYERDRETARNSEKHRTFREYLTIVGLFLAAVIAFFQWRELRSTDRNIGEQARISAEQLTIMSRTLERDERAQLIALHVSIDTPKAGAPLAGQLIVVNSGRREAQILTNVDANGEGITNFKVFMGKHLPSRDDNPGYKVEFGPCAKETAVASLRMEAGQQTQWCFQQTKPLMTDEEVAKINSGADGLKLWAFGIFQYAESGPTTRNGPIHFTFVCRQYEPESGRLIYTDDKDCNYTN
jgi:hypothetical protein